MLKYDVFDQRRVFQLTITGSAHNKNSRSFMACLDTPLKAQCNVHSNRTDNTSPIKRRQIRSGIINSDSKPCFCEGLTAL